MINYVHHILKFINELSTYRSTNVRTILCGLIYVAVYYLIRGSSEIRHRNAQKQSSIQHMDIGRVLII